MRLKKEDVYINLRGKSKKELTDLYWLLKNNNEEVLNDGLNLFTRCYLNIESKYDKFHFYSEVWSCAGSSADISKQEVTIEQLKEILQPMENLQEKEQRLLKELEEVRKEMEENEPKAGDWCKFWDNDKSIFIVGKFGHIDEIEGYSFCLDGVAFKNCEKITNPELIKLLEDESK